MLWIHTILFDIIILCIHISYNHGEKSFDGPLSSVDIHVQHLSDYTVMNTHTCLI